MSSRESITRKVFTLREVSGYGYPDVAQITGKTEGNCRQIFARARQRGGPKARNSPAGSHLKDVGGQFRGA